MVRRFVAGAICPECGTMDTTTVEMVDGEPRERHCVECGYQDESVGGSGALPRGRLEKSAATKGDARSDPVQLLRFREEP